MSPITIDVVSDVVCPWCYLGKRRLEQALTIAAEIDVHVRWRPYRLDPTIPPEGIDRDDYIVRKFGSLDAIDEAHRRLVEFGRAEGIDYRFDRIKRSPNTVNAHRLIQWAAAGGVEDAMVERLFKAYFTEGRDIGDATVLAALAADVGIKAGSLAARLNGDEDRETVVAGIEDAYRIGVTGVPSFIIDNRYAVVGAHPGESIARAIRQAGDERENGAAARAAN